MPLRSTGMKRGDLVYLDWGVMVGSDFGTVVGVEETAFGTNYWVRKTDFTLSCVQAPDGTVEGRVYQDYEGSEFMSVRGGGKIGAYLVNLV